MLRLTTFCVLLVLCPMMLQAAPQALVPQAPVSQACADADLLCIKRRLAEKVLELQAMSAELTASQGLVIVYKESAEEWQRTSESLKSLGERHWYEHPWLWLCAGFVVAGIVYAVSLKVAGDFVAGLKSNK